MPRILLIDDDEELGPPLATYFKRYEFDLQQATQPSAGLKLLRAGGFDAAILDIMLPEMDGLQLCRAIRAESNIPVIMLSARGDVMDRVVGLELGADDYLPKPFEPRELVVRLQTVLRRAVPHLLHAHAQHPRELRFDGLTIDLDRRSVQRGSAIIELTSTEFELLVFLASAPHKVFSRDDILEKLRGHSAEDIHSRAVDILVSRLRRKLEPLDCIHTLRNAGYTFAGVRV